MRAAINNKKLYELLAEAASLKTVLYGIDKGSEADARALSCIAEQFRRRISHGEFNEDKTETLWQQLLFVSTDTAEAPEPDLDKLLERIYLRNMECNHDGLDEDTTTRLKMYIIQARETLDNWSQQFDVPCTYNEVGTDYCGNCGLGFEEHDEAGARDDANDNESAADFEFRMRRNG